MCKQTFSKTTNWIALKSFSLYITPVASGLLDILPALFYWLDRGDKMKRGGNAALPTHTV